MVICPTRALTGGRRMEILCFAVLCFPLPPARCGTRFCTMSCTNYTRMMCPINAPAIGQTAHTPTKAAWMKPTTGCGKKPANAGNCFRPSIRGAYAANRAGMAVQQKPGKRITTRWSAPVLATALIATFWQRSLICTREMCSTTCEDPGP